AAAPADGFGGIKAGADGMAGERHDGLLAAVTGTLQRQISLGRLVPIGRGAGGNTGSAFKL
ncbi:hypothetical protein P3W85_34455, partial [Cupriavidus basilensis]